MKLHLLEDIANLNFTKKHNNGKKYYKNDFTSP